MIKIFKRRKAPGPDEMPMEVFKEMKTESLEEIREILNEWWREAEIPEEITKSKNSTNMQRGRHKQI